jgi:hypothetical protein
MHLGEGLLGYYYLEGLSLHSVQRVLSLSLKEYRITFFVKMTR